MLAKLKQFLSAHTHQITPEERAHQLNLAAASLLLEVVFADETLTDEEALALPKQLTRALALSDAQANELIAEAKVIQNDSTSLYEFTSEINQQCSLEQKQQLILSMWKLAYADGELCRYEDQIIRRTATMLSLRQSELIQMRNLAMESLKDNNKPAN